MTIARLAIGETERILRQESIGRLGCVVNGEPYVVPVHYYFDGHDIFVHSLPGRKIDALRANPRACLQVDEIQDSFHWRSVLAYGTYEEITDERLREQAIVELFKRVPQMTPVESRLMEGSPTTIVFRLHIDQVTGVGETW